MQKKISKMERNWIEMKGSKMCLAVKTSSIYTACQYFYTAIM